MNYDKRNGDVIFIEDTHQYKNIKYPDRDYTSVTTLISKFHPKFDTEFWSSYKALEALTGDAFKLSGVKQLLLNKKVFDIDFVESMRVDMRDFLAMKEELVNKYARNNREACERGTIYHKRMEEALYATPTLTSDQLPFVLPLPSRQYAIVRDDCDLTRDHDIKSEFLLYWSSEDQVLNIAGQADLIVKEGNDIYILDHKTNGKGIELSSYYDRKKKKSERMFHPINHLEDCDLVHYTLQLSLYAWMLQKINPNFNIKLLRLLHIDKEDKETEYDLEYRKEDVELMLKAYKVKLIEQYYRKYGRMP